MSYIENISIESADGPAIDAFGRWRTCHSESIFDSKLILDAAPLRWDDAETSGTGTSTTYNTNQASQTIAVGNLTAGKRTRQSKRRFGYQTGKSQLIMFTAVFGAAATGITRRVGYFDDQNGLFFEQTSTGMAVVRRTYTGGSASNNSVAQASWNMDTMDGNGPSKINLNFAKTQIFLIDFEWLGVGRVRFGFVIDGKIVYCHQLLNANNLTVVYMSVPNLPVRYEIENGGTGGAASLVQICCTVQSEGGQDAIGLTFGLNRGTTALTTLNDADIYPLMAIRYQTGRTHIPIRILDYSVVCTTATTVFAAYLMLNPTVAGTALSFTTLTNSAIEYDISRTNGSKVSGGTVINSITGYSNRSSVVVESPADISLGATIAGTSDILVLAVQRLTGTTEPFWGAINWRELR